MTSTEHKRYLLGTAVDKALLRDSPEERYSWRVWLVDSINDLTEAIYSYLPCGAELVTWRYEAACGQYEVLFRFKELTTPRGVYRLVESEGKTVVSIEGVSAREVLEAWAQNGCNFVIDN